MSSIDERIVGMKFDNAQFERGAQSSMRTLSDLKKSLDFGGAGRSLQELRGVADGFHMGAMGSAVDGIAGKFNALQVAGIAALATIASKATSVGLGMARDMIMTQPLEGLREYETQINAVQTIQANTASKGTTMPQISAALAELNEYADMTIYNFSEMTRNIGTFTAAGVGLDQSVAAIKGIANVAAMAGSNSQQASTAMYQMSQAMSSGTVRLQDWMSIENAGMGTEAFRNSIMETARNHGVAIDSLIEKNGSFRNSLQEGWLSAEIMTETLSKFTGDLTDEQLRSLGYTDEQIVGIQETARLASDAATKVKTFSQLMGTFAEATASGWAQSWQIVLGDFEEAKLLFTEISEIVGGMIGASADARNAQLQIWKDGGGREAVIQALRNAFEALMSVIKPIGDAFAKVFPPSLGNTLLDMSFAIRDFTSGLILSEEQSATVGRVFEKIFGVLKVGVDIFGVAAGFLFSGLGDLFNILGAILGMAGPLITWFSNLGGEAEGGGQGIADFTDELIRIKDVIVGGLIVALQWLTELFQKLINGDYSGIGDMFEAAGQPIYDMAMRVKAVWEGVLNWFDGVFQATGINLSNSWQGVLDSLGSVGDFLKDIAQGFEDFFASFSEGADAAFSSVDPTAVLAALNAGVLGGFVIAIFQAFRDVTGIFDNLGSIVDSVAEALDGLTGVLAGMEAKLKAEAVLKIALAIGVLALALLVMSQIDPDRLVSSVTALATTFTIMMVALTVMDKIASGKGIARMPFIAASMLILSVAINLLSLAILRLGGMSWEELAKGLGAVAVSIGLLLAAAKVMKGQEGDMMKSAAALIIFSAALYALTGVIMILGMMPMETLAQGMIAVSIMMAMLTATAYLLGSQQGNMLKASVGMIAMSTALGMLAGVIILLGNIDFAILEQGLAVTGIMLTGMVAAAYLLGKAAPSMGAAAVGMISMAAALALLIIPITVLGQMDIAVLAQGMLTVGIMMGALVFAANAMKTALPGASAMIVMALSLILIAGAIHVLSGIPIEAVSVALFALLGVFTILAAAGAVIGPLLPALAGLAGVIVLLSIAFAIFAVGMMVLAPALVALTGSLLIFAQVADVIVAAAPAMIGIGLALIVFGAGAAVAGAGAIILGAGLLLMGAGLALLGVSGMLGIYVLVQLVTQLGALGEHIPAMLGFGAALLVLGIGIAVLGVGVLALGLGVLGLGVGLMLLTAVGAAAVPVIILLMNTMIGLIPPFIEAIGLGITWAVEMMRTKIPEFVEAAKELILAFLEGVQEIVPEVYDTVEVMLQEMIDFIVNSVEMFVDGAMRLIEGFLRGVANKIPDVVDAATDVIVTFLNEIGDNSKRVVDAGFDLLIDFINGIADSVRANSRRVEDAGWNLASALIDGVVGGIGRGVGRVITAAQNMASSAFEAAMNFLNINSPSKLFRDKIGEPIAEGTAVGIDQGAPMVVKSVEDMGAKAVTAMASAMTAMEDAAYLETDIQPTITPVVDMAKVRQAAEEIGRSMPKPELDFDLSRKTADAISAERLAQVEALLETQDSTPPQVVNNFEYSQTNISPDPLPVGEIWRQTNSQFATLKGALPHA